MATFTEDQIHINLLITRDPQDSTDHVFVVARTFDSVRGVQVRNIARREITNLLSPARMTGIGSLLDDVFQRLRTELDIPNAVFGVPSSRAVQPTEAMKAEGTTPLRRVRKKG